MPKYRVAQFCETVLHVPACHRQNNSFCRPRALNVLERCKRYFLPSNGEKNMKISFWLSCVSLLALTISVASAQEARRGTVVGVDEPTGSITIQQSADGTVGANNPARSSDKFAVQDGLLFNALRTGDKVMFNFQEINGVNTITQLQKE
jgi:Cu/Ag efflux protein CusF